MSIKNKLNIFNDTISPEIKQIIFGSLLGDGKLEMSNSRSTNARFGFTQSKFQMPYFLTIFNALSFLCSSSYVEYSYLDKRTGKTYSNLSFKTKSLAIFTEFYNLSRGNPNFFTKKKNS